MDKPRAYIGTSGWNYKHWRNLIYAPKFAQRKWLGFIAERFNTVEVNTSFYRIPASETIEAWQAGTPDHFKFALKVWRGITHYKKLKDASGFNARFLEVAEHLAVSRRAPLLLQLPPNQGKDIAKLDGYLAEFRMQFTKRWQLAVEFRNDSWLDAETYRVLDRHQTALCLHDMRGKAAVDEPNDAPLVYIRRHGTAEGRYAGSYSPEDLQLDAKRIRKWTREGRSVYEYFNNDIGGHAFWNAEQLVSMI